MSPTRPIAPHVGIYRWRYTFFNPSLLHRASGLILTLGLIPLSYFLGSLASGPESYERAVAVFGAPWFRIVYAALMWALSFHLVAGLRHLVMDSGVGLDRKANRASAIGLFVASSLLTLAGWGWLAVR